MNTRLLLITLSLGAYGLPAHAQTTPAAPAAKAAQPAGSGRLSGRVVDARTRTPIEFATAGLHDAQGQAVNGAICDGQGRFTISGVASGQYELRLSFLGYQTLTLPAVVGTGALELGVVELTPAAQQLREVTVQGQRDLVEDKVDRLIYNAERDASTAGGTAADVLRKAPLVSVDLEGNVQLRGSGGVRVLINGKPSGVFAGSVADALKQIPADQIKSVEIITSPSAKYDAEGAGGIINLVLKRADRPELSGTLSATAGTRSSSFGLNEGFRRQRLAVNFNAGGTAFYTRRKSRLTRLEFPGNRPLEYVAQLDQQRFQRNLGGNGYGQLTLDYELSPRDVLSACVVGSFLRYRVGADLASQYRAPGWDDDYLRELTNHNAYDNLDLSLGYVRTFRPKHELSLLAQYTTGRGTIEYDLEQTRGLPYRENSRNGNPNRELTLQLDYAQPAWGGTLELGAKAIDRRTESNFLVRYDSTETRNWQLDPTRSNHFRYAQDVYAAYGSYNRSLAHGYALRLGLRAEQTTSRGELADAGLVVRQHYANLLPNLTVSRELGAAKTTRLRASYTRRLQRPGIYFLNPFLNTQDRQNVSAGNPWLKPEVTDSYELGLSALLRKKINLNAVAYARSTSDVIEEVSRLVPARSLYPAAPPIDVRFASYQNIARTAAYGVSLATGANVSAKLNVSANLTTNYLVLRSPSLQLTRRGVVANASLSARWLLGDGYTAQLNYGLNTRSLELQSRTSTYHTHGLSLRKELASKRGSWSLAVDNPLASAIHLRSELQAPGLLSTANTYVYMRGIRASLSWALGGKTSGPARSNRTISNTDQKQGRNDWQ